MCCMFMCCIIRNMCRMFCIILIICCIIRTMCCMFYIILTMCCMFCIIVICFVIMFEKMLLILEKFYRLIMIFNLNINLLSEPVPKRKDTPRGIAICCEELPLRNGLTNQFQRQNPAAIWWWKQRGAHTNVLAAGCSDQIKIASVTHYMY